MLVLMAVPVTAAETLDYKAPQKIYVGDDGTAQLEISVSGGENAYAGAQFELVLGVGIEILDVSFDKGGNSNVIPPAETRGSHFFSLFSGTNEFEGDFTCTVTLSYEGTEPGFVTVAEIQRYFIESPGYVSTTSNSDTIVIEVLTSRNLFEQSWFWLIIAFIATFALMSVMSVRLKRRKKKKAAQGEARQQISVPAPEESAPPRPTAEKTGVSATEDDLPEPVPASTEE